MRVRDVIRMLEEDGWQLVRTRGSHRQSSAVSASDQARYRNGSREAQLGRAGCYTGQYSQAIRFKETELKYLVIFEETARSVGAYVLDLPGCVAIGETREEAKQLIREAIELHIDNLRENGEPVPEPHSSVEVVTV